MSQLPQIVLPPWRVRSLVVPPPPPRPVVLSVPKVVPPRVKTASIPLVLPPPAKWYVGCKRASPGQRPAPVGPIRTIAATVSSQAEADMQRLEAMYGLQNPETPLQDANFQDDWPHEDFAALCPQELEVATKHEDHDGSSSFAVVATKREDHEVATKREDHEVATNQDDSHYYAKACHMQ